MQQLGLSRTDVAPSPHTRSTKLLFSNSLGAITDSYLMKDRFQDQEDGVAARVALDHVFSDFSYAEADVVVVAINKMSSTVRPFSHPGRT